MAQNLTHEIETQNMENAIISNNYAESGIATETVEKAILNRLTELANKNKAAEVALKLVQLVNNTSLTAQQETSIANAITDMHNGIVGMLSNGGFWAGGSLNGGSNSTQDLTLKGQVARLTDTSLVQSRILEKILTKLTAWDKDDMEYAALLDANRHQMQTNALLDNSTTTTDDKSSIDGDVNWDPITETDVEPPNQHNAALPNSSAQSADSNKTHKYEKAKCFVRTIAKKIN